MITDDFLGHLGVAGLITGAIEVLKRLDVPMLRWISKERKAVLIVLSAAGAFFTSLGFQMTWEGTWPNLSDLLANGGTMNISVVIPKVDTLIRAVGQFMMNVGTYHGMVKPVVPNGNGS